MGMAALCQLIRRTPSCIRAQQTQSAVSPLFVSPHRSARSIAHPFNSNPYRFLDYSRENVFWQEVPEKTLFFVYSSTIFHSKRVFPMVIKTLCRVIDEFRNCSPRLITQPLISSINATGGSNINLFGHLIHHPIRRLLMQIGFHLIFLIILSIPVFMFCFRKTAPHECHLRFRSSGRSSLYFCFQSSEIRKESQIFWMALPLILYFRSFF